MLRAARIADAGGDVVHRAGQLDRAAQRLGDAVDDAQHVGLHFAEQQHHELVATEARDGVGLPQAALQAARDGTQQLVAGGMAEGVVHQLEVVEVDEQHHQVQAEALALAQRLRKAIAEQLAVRQRREFVVGGAVRQRLLGGHALADVDLRTDVVGQHALRVAHWRDDEVDPVRAAVLAEIAQQHLPVAAFAQGMTQGFQPGLLAFGTLQEIEVAAQQLGGAVAAHGFQRGVHVHGRPAVLPGIDDSHACGRGVERALEQSEAIDGAEFLADVGDAADGAHRMAGRVAQDHQAVAGMARASVRLVEPVGDLPLDHAGVQRLRIALAHPLAVLRVDLGEPVGDLVRGGVRRQAEHAAERLAAPQGVALEVGVVDAVAGGAGDQREALALAGLAPTGPPQRQERHAHRQEQREDGEGGR